MAMESTVYLQRRLEILETALAGLLNAIEETYGESSATKQIRNQINLDFGRLNHDVQNGVL